MTAGPQARRNLRIGFIGAGQLAVPVAWSLARAGFQVVGAVSRSQASAEKLSSDIPNARAFGDAQELAHESDLVVIAVPDDAIAPVARAVTWRQNHYVVHSSAATEVSALSAAAEQGASTGGFHPLQTFTNAEAAIQTLPGCAAAIEAEETSPCSTCSGAWPRRSAVIRSGCRRARGRFITPRAASRARSWSG